MHRGAWTETSLQEFLLWQSQWCFSRAKLPQKTTTNRPRRKSAPFQPSDREEAFHLLSLFLFCSKKGDSGVLNFQFPRTQIVSKKAACDSALSWRVKYVQQQKKRRQDNTQRNRSHRMFGKTSALDDYAPGTIPIYRPSWKMKTPGNVRHVIPWKIIQWQKQKSGGKVHQCNYCSMPFHCINN